MPFLFIQGFIMSGFIKRKLFVILFAVVFIFCIITSTMFTSAKDIMVFNLSKNSNFVLINDNLMLSDFSENQLNIDGVSHKDIDYSYKFEQTVNGVTFSKNGFCIYNMIDSDEDNNNIYNFKTYKYNGDYYYESSLNLDFHLNNKNFAIDDNFAFYVSNCENDNTIYKITNNYRLNKVIHADGIIDQLFYFNGKVYAVCNSRIYLIDNDKLKAVYSTDKITTPVTITGSNTLTDGSGKVFDIQDNGFILVADFNSNNNLCLKTENHYLYFNGNQALGNKITNSDIGVEYTFGFDVVEAYYIDSYIYAIGIKDDKYIVEYLQDNELNIVENDSSKPSTLPNTEDDITANVTEPSPTQVTSNSTEPITEETNKTEPVTDIPANPTTSTTLSPTEKTSEPNTITSNKYTINQGVISNIQTGTTVAEFKKSFNFAGDIIILKKNNNTKNSGYVGTGMKAVFNGTTSTTYTLCVFGDLTGEGNVNSLDVNKMFDFLLNIKEPTAVEFISGDINHDGKLSNVDLLLLSRLTKQ